MMTLILYLCTNVVKQVLHSTNAYTVGQCICSTSTAEQDIVIIITPYIGINREWIQLIKLSSIIQLKTAL